jgi:carboxymethylenebutenolidase
MMARARRLDVAQAVRDLRATLDALEGGRAGVIGFCIGGALSLLLAAEGRLDACVSCYGRLRWMHDPGVPHPLDEARRIACPTLAVYGRRDASIPVEQAEELLQRLPKASELALYDAGHAFLNDTRPDMYVDAAATLAWPKIYGFLHRTLS